MLKISLRFAKLSRSDCRPTLSSDMGIGGHSSRGLFGDGVGEIRGHSEEHCKYGKKEQEWMGVGSRRYYAWTYTSEMGG